MFYNFRMDESENPLNRKEITILRYVAQGWNAKAIARILELSPRTIHLHFTIIKRKLNAQTLAMAMYISGRDGLLGEYDPGDEV